MQRIVILNSNTYHGFSLEDAVNGAKKAGISYIELTATKGWTEHVFPDMPFERLLEIKSLLRNEGIIPISLSGHCNLMAKARLGDFIKNIYLASFFECKYIVSSIGEAHLLDLQSTELVELVENIRSLIPYLEECNLILVLETHGKDYATGKAIKDIVNIVNHERVKLNYDTANVIFYGNVDPIEDIQGCLEELAYIHLKDKAGAWDAWNFPAIGKGNIDFLKIFKILDDNAKLCPLSIEIEFSSEGAQNLAEVNKAVLDSASYLRQHNIF